jgi:hypothetical protein
VEETGHVDVCAVPGLAGDLVSGIVPDWGGANDFESAAVIRCVSRHGGSP